MVNDWRGRTTCVQVSHLCGVRGCLQTDGLTPLHVAVQACNVRVVEALAALGADVNRAMVRCFEQGRAALCCQSAHLVLVRAGMDRCPYQDVCTNFKCQARLQRHWH